MYFNYYNCRKGHIAQKGHVVLVLDSFIEKNRSQDSLIWLLLFSKVVWNVFIRTKVSLANLTFNKFRL